MAITQEMFRFVATRRPERATMSRINSRLIRDRRRPTRESLLVVLFGPGSYASKLREANRFAASADFLAADDPAVVALEPVVDFFREKLAPGVAIEQLADDFEAAHPLLAALLQAAPPAGLLEATVRMVGRHWDALYAQAVRGCDRYVSTNYAADGLRAYHVLGLLWLSRKLGLTSWAGGAFDEYEVLIDLDAAATVGAGPQDEVGDALAVQPPVKGAAATLAGLADGVARFRVPLSVGETKPPTVGDLILVEQELRRYELGELADIESIMRGERRERTTRNLARTSHTTTTETVSEEESSSSLKTDERFQLSSQAQHTASEDFGVQAGVNVSGKFGPVQVSASVNASYNTSESTSDSTAQEYAKTVTEEATRRVKNSIKETSSVTILTETQDTTLRGFNNEAGTSHLNGLYRWVDKIYTARLMNYGRRLMLSLNVPEPAGFYRALLSQDEAVALADLPPEPLHPSRISRATLDPLPESNTISGFLSYQDVDEGNYAKLAALYDVTGLQPPPAEFLTGSKAIVYPEAMQAGPLNVHDQVNDLSYVAGDNTLTLDPGYRLTYVNVYATEGSNGSLGSYVDALKLGEVAGPSAPSDGTLVSEANLLLVQVGHRSFYLSVRRDPDDADRKIINSNFNVWQEIDEDWSAFGEVVKPAIPITVTAKFEGMFSFTVVYRASRLPEAYDAWKAQTYAAIVKGYTAKKQAYDQALALAQAKAQAGTEAQTLALREDQYRSIEVTELKRGCIDLLTEGTAAGHTSVAVAADGTPRIVYDEAEGNLLTDWRPPLANGAVAEFFEQAFEWPQMTYEFHPYYWAGAERWKETAQAAGADPVFEQFLRAGNAAVVVPVRPGHERSAVLFLKTGLIWGGGYLPLFTSRDMLDVYADVELGLRIDPPEQLGDPWEVRLPTNLVMLQEGDALPEFPADEQPATGDEAEVPEPEVDETVPF